LPISHYIYRVWNAAVSKRGFAGGAGLQGVLVSVLAEQGFLRGNCPGGGTAEEGEKAKLSKYSALPLILQIFLYLLAVKNNITYKVVKRAPAKPIIALYKDAGWWVECPLSYRTLSGLIRDSLCFMVALDAERKIIGMGRLIGDRYSDAYIEDVVVLRQHRGKGIGRELVSRLAQWAKDREYEWIGLIAMPGTAKFYEGIGFRKLPNYVPMCL
jgi:aralkylamine N-acetyltransferase